eukprot:GHVU01108099.1.p1 GENE.GHVU01108099.1~~GHVU01108099.1.p1  ORF type:complete len:110 (-),score=16.45 GHVU01108099.1:46-375(-)
MSNIRPKQIRSCVIKTPSSVKRKLKFTFTDTATNETKRNKENKPETDHHSSDECTQPASKNTAPPDVHIRKMNSSEIFPNWTGAKWEDMSGCALLFYDNIAVEREKWKR